MARALIAVEAEPFRLLDAIRDALAGGPAVHPYPVGGAPADSLPETVSANTAAVLGTSGSTGAPKLVRLSGAALLASAAAAQRALGGPGQWLLALPAHWVAGFGVLVRSIAMSTTPVVVASALEPASFVNAASQMTGYGSKQPAVTVSRRYTSLVPVQLAGLLRDADGRAALSSFDRILLGGQAPDSALIAAARAAGVRITTTYGATETSGGCVWDGTPIGDTALELREGAIHIAGSVLADGYLDDPSRELAAFSVREGQRWYRTGDRGRFLDGRLLITGREDDVIVSGGAKLDLADLRYLLEHSAPSAPTVVLGIPDGDWGSAPAVIHTGPLDADAVRAEATRKLGLAASRMRILCVEQIPVTASGKPDREACAALLATEGAGFRP